jgi:hypothetical protein
MNYEQQWALVIMFIVFKICDDIILNNDFCRGVNVINIIYKIVRVSYSQKKSMFLMWHALTPC